MRGAWVGLGVAIAGCTPAENEGVDPDSAVDTDAPAVDEGPEPGPGVPAQTWSEADLFRPVGWIDTTNGVPEPSDDFPITRAKPYGLNVVAMHEGYLVSVFAPDSGFGPGGLMIHDLSDPRAPRLVSRVFEPETGGRTSDFRESHALAFSHRGGRKLMAMHTGLGVKLWDLADPTDPTVVGQLDLPGVFFGDYTGVAWQLAWAGRWLYVAGSSDGLFVVDTLDPENPVLADRGGAPNPIPTSELGGFRIGPVFAYGTRLFVSSMDNESGHAVLDASDPLFPTLLSLRTGLPKFYASCFSGGLVASSMRGGGARMHLDDVRDPFEPRWLDTDLVVDEQLYCAFQDSHVFQGCQGEVVKIDLSDPTEPAIVGRGSLGVPNPDHGQVTPIGNLVFVGNDHGTGSALIVHDLAPDTTPPAVNDVAPTDGEVGVGLWARVGVTFTDGVRVRTVNPRTFVVRAQGGEAVPGSFTVQQHFVTFQPDAPLAPDTAYEVEVRADGVQDWAGNATASAFRSTFRTAAFAPDDPRGALAVSLEVPRAVAVGEPVTLHLDVDGATEGEASWRLDGDAPWVRRADLGDLTHTWSTPGHRTVIVSVTNGVRRVVVQRRVVVHRPLPERPPAQSRSLALGDDGVWLWVTNPDHGTVSALDAATLALMHEVPVGANPRSVAVDGEGRVWAAASDALTVISGATAEVLHTVPLPRGSAPAGVVVAPTGDRVYVALEGRDEVVAFDPDSRGEVARAAVARRPFGLAISGDGARVFVTGRIAPTDEGAEVTRLDARLNVLGTLVVPTDTATLDAEDRGRGVPNDLRAAGLSPDEAELWLPAKQDNVLRGGFRDGRPLTHETAVRAVVPRLVLPAGDERSGLRLDLNDRAPPVDVAFTPLGDRAVLALEGSDRLVLVDAYGGEVLGQSARVGSAPRGVLVSPEGDRLFAHHVLSRTVTAHDLSGLPEGRGHDLRRVGVGSTVSSEVLDPVVLAGKRIFHAAWDPRMSKDGYLACATCHPDGGEDGRVWDFTDRGEGLRNTIDLRGRAGMGHGPLHWTANFDEVQDFENDIRGPFGGTGFLAEPDFLAGTRRDPLGDPKVGLSPDLDALAAYVASLGSVPVSPWRSEEGELSAEARVGEGLFLDLGCGDCHGGAELTVSAAGERFDVGTITSATGQRRGGPLDGLDVPTLRGLHATAPYLHDGSATTLREVLTAYNPSDAHGATSPLDDEALDALVAFLLQLE